MKYTLKYVVLMAIITSGFNGCNSDKTKQKTATSGNAETITGTYLYLADVAGFTPCDGGKSVDVISPGLEKKYLQLDANAEPVYVKVTGYYDMRPNMEDRPTRHLIVEKIIEIDAGKGCD